VIQEQAAGMEKGAAATNPDGFRIDLSQSNHRWDGRTKVRRVLWNAVWLLLFRPTPKRLGNSFRIFLLRRFGAVIEGTPLVEPSCKILQPWQLEIGACSAIGHHVEIYNYARVTIGPMSVVSQYSFLCTGTHDYTDPFMPLIWFPIAIGAECWVASGVYIAPGVTINDGVVVGARSVVTKTLPPWTVCAGHPCKVLKDRLIHAPVRSMR
jgi:putative colanic acid biosynthesis acetyltransferase WcaF